MIDYTKAVVPGVHWETLRDHELLDFHRPVNEDTGDIAHHRARVADFGPFVRSGHGPPSAHGRRALRFHRFPSELILLDGSWHKYAQDGTNYGDFTLDQFRRSVEQVCSTFGLDPFTLCLQNLEAGVNLVPPLPVPEILERVVCHREGATFSPMRSRSGRSLGLELYRTEYGLKFYDKGSQYRLPSALVRFEVKFIKARTFNRLGIYTLGDLFDPEKWAALEREILRLFDLIVFNEPGIPVEALSPSEAAFLDNAIRATHWKKLSPKERDRSRTRLERIAARHAYPALKAWLYDATGAKCHELRTGARLQSEGDVLTAAQPVENGDVLTGTLTLPPTVTGGGSHPSIMGEFVPSHLEERARRFCASCGRDISEQDPRSRVCSERLYGKAGKKCRNAISNRSLTLRRMTSRGAWLFDNGPYLSR